MDFDLSRISILTSAEEGELALSYQHAAPYANDARNNANIRIWQLRFRIALALYHMDYGKLPDEDWTFPGSLRSVPEDAELRLYTWRTEIPDFLRVRKSFEFRHELLPFQQGERPLPSTLAEWAEVIPVGEKRERFFSRASMRRGGPAWVVAEFYPHDSAHSGYGLYREYIVTSVPGHRLVEVTDLPAKSASLNLHFNPDWSEVKNLLGWLDRRAAGAAP